MTAIRSPAFSFSKRALTLSNLFSAVLLSQGGRLFCFLSMLSRVSKRAPEEMEVNSEESKPSKFQAKQNQTGIPFPYRPSRSDGEACLYSNPAVRGVPLSQAWLSMPGRGWRMYAHKIDETISSRTPVLAASSAIPSVRKSALTFLLSPWSFIRKIACIAATALKSVLPESL